MQFLLSPAYPRLPRLFINSLVYPSTSRAREVVSSYSLAKLQRTFSLIVTAYFAHDALSCLPLFLQLSSFLFLLLLIPSRALGNLLSYIRFANPSLHLAIACVGNSLSKPFYDYASASKACLKPFAKFITNSQTMSIFSGIEQTQYETPILEAPSNTFERINTATVQIL